MNRTVTAALVTGALALGGLALTTPAFAQEPPAERQEAKAGNSPEGGSGMPGPDVHESEATGIINWWSWDHGPNAKDPAHRNWPPPFGFALINFAVFLGLLGRFAWPGLKSYTRTRHETIKADLDAAAELRQKAEAELTKYQAKIASLDGEIDTLLKQIHQEAEAEKARIIASAEADARRIKEDAQRQIAAEIDRARRELRQNVIAAALAAAQETLQKNIGADDQRKMAERYVAEMEQSARTAAGRPA